MGGLAITLPGEAVLFSIKAVITRGGGGGWQGAAATRGHLGRFSRKCDRTANEVDAVLDFHRPLSRLHLVI